MKRTNDGPLEQRPRALDAVRVDITTNPLFCAMVDRLMNGVGVSDALVGRVLIGHQALRFGAYGVLHESVPCFAAGT